MRQQEIKINIKGLVDAGLYESEERAMQEALKALLKENPEIRIKMALHRYKNEKISIGKAAEIANVCWEDMKKILIENGITPRLAPRTIEEAQEDYHTIDIHKKNFNHEFHEQDELHKFF